VVGFEILQGRFQEARVVSGGGAGRSVRNPAVLGVPGFLKRRQDRRRRGIGRRQLRAGEQRGFAHEGIFVVENFGGQDCLE
jgi:hypothetical protein